jgi:DMSO/TMAO reductase YedYZ molybdopterin-dependent catalytic subunit
VLGQLAQLLPSASTGCAVDQRSDGKCTLRGARLKDVLRAAGVRAGAVEASFRGVDVPPLQASPHFEKTLTIDHALNGKSIIAYENEWRAAAEC